MSTPLVTLVETIASLSLRRHPDLPPSMYIEKHTPSQLVQHLGWKVSDELVALYCTATLMTEPWPGILFNSPRLIPEDCNNSNSHLRTHSPPMKVQAGVRAPVSFGERLVPIAYHDDSLYCIDMAPDVSTGGVPKQIVNVSLRKGIAKVAFPSLEAFLADGLKRMKREMKREQVVAPQSDRMPVMTLEQAAQITQLLANPSGYFQSLLPKIPVVAESSNARSEVQRRQHASDLLALNPRRTELQRVCAELVEFYARDETYEDALMQTSPPMPAAQRGKIQRALGIALPTDLNELLDAHATIGVPWDNIAYLGLDANVAKQCQQLKAIGVAAESWGLWPGTTAPNFGKGLVPLNADDPVVCCDLQPGEGGTVGQIVEVSFEMATCKVVGRTLLELLTQGLSRIRVR